MYPYVLAPLSAEAFVSRRRVAQAQTASSSAHSALATTSAVLVLDLVTGVLVAVLWFGNLLLGVLFGIALLITLIFAALAGVAIPLLFDRFGVDPALASGVFMTTVTDVVGFLSFLGLATLFLL